MPGVGGAMAEGLIGGLGSVFLIVVLIAVVRWIMKLSRAAKSLPLDLAARKVANSEAEECRYEFIRQEIESGEIRSGLWTKAEATANSTENAAIRAKYIQLRFEQLEAQGQHNQIADEVSVSTVPEPKNKKPSQKEIPQHMDSSKPWYVREAEQGYANAQFNLGMRYEEGQGVPQNYAEAYVWFSLAALSGYNDAIRSRDLLAKQLSPEDLSASQKRASMLYEEIQQRKANE